MVPLHHIIHQKCFTYKNIIHQKCSPQHILFQTCYPTPHHPPEMFPTSLFIHQKCFLHHSSSTRNVPHITLYSPDMFPTSLFIHQKCSPHHSSSTRNVPHITLRPPEMFLTSLFINHIKCITCLTIYNKMNLLKIRRFFFTNAGKILDYYKSSGYHKIIFQEVRGEPKQYIATTSREPTIYVCEEKHNDHNKA